MQILERPQPVWLAKPFALLWAVYAATLALFFTTRGRVGGPTINALVDALPPRLWSTENVVVEAAMSHGLTPLLIVFALVPLLPILFITRHSREPMSPVFRLVLSVTALVVFISLLTCDYSTAMYRATVGSVIYAAIYLTWRVLSLFSVRRSHL